MFHVGVDEKHGTANLNHECTPFENVFHAFKTEEDFALALLQGRSSILTLTAASV
jgi:hypothetical protein